MIFIYRNTIKFIIFAALTVTVFAMTASAAPNNKLIKVGVTASLSGVYQEQGENLLRGIKMWANDVNARGALLGKDIEIIHYDDQSDPEQSAKLYERLINVDGVDLLIGPYSSDVTLRASDVAEKYKMPMVSGTAAASQIWNRGYQNIFQVDLPAEQYLVDGLRVAKARGLKTLAIVFQDSVFTSEVAMGAKKAAEKMDIELLVFEQYSSLRSDFSELIKKLVQKKPQLVLGATYFDDAIAIVRESKKQHFSPLAFGFTSGPSLAAFGEALGDDAENIIGFTPWIHAVRVPLAFDFDFRYRHIYGHAADSNAAGGYAAGEVLEAAVRLAGTLDQDKMRKQLQSMSFLSIVGRYRVDSTGKQIGKAMYALQWQNNQRRLVLPYIFAEAQINFLLPWEER
ncbi:amino acid ABC transporter substrate-binding protein [Psychromonas sp. MME2]|uniref:amino acid ABC transporter substrate-binding protein n=1 Tax=unclassified Psychromonas TaxID=2614957 RepID=UPI00339C192B